MMRESDDHGETICELLGLINRQAQEIGRLLKQVNALNEDVIKLESDVERYKAVAARWAEEAMEGRDRS